MSLKKISVKKSGENRTKIIAIELKREIIDKHEQGVRVIDLALGNAVQSHNFYIMY